MLSELLFFNKSAESGNEFLPNQLVSSLLKADLRFFIYLLYNQLIIYNLMDLSKLHSLEYKTGLMNNQIVKNLTFSVKKEIIQSILETYNLIHVKSKYYNSMISRVGTDNSITNLCNYDMARGNYPSIVHQILKNAKITESITYKYDEGYNFHILKDKNLLFVCMAGSAMKIKVAFGFLQEIRKQFKSKYTAQQINNARDFDMSAGFSDVFKNQIAFFNTTQSQDKKDVLMKELTQLQEVMSENIEKVLQNQEKVQIIVKKSIKYDSIADQIKKNASKMKKQAFWDKNKCKIAVGFLAVGAAMGLIFII